MDMRYPIGEFKHPGVITAEQVNGWINEIMELPKRLSEITSNLNDDQLNTAYREEGWTIRQVVHHIADSHMNAYIRFKWALTESTPVIKTYNEVLWAELADSKMPIEVSISLIYALHERWTYLLQSLTEEDLLVKFIHPDSGEISLGENIGRYAWHGNHHYAHIKTLCSRMDWL